MKRSLYQVRDCPMCGEEDAVFIRCGKDSHEWRCMACNGIRDDRDWYSRVGCGLTWENDDVAGDYEYVFEDGALFLVLKGDTTK